MRFVGWDGILLWCTLVLLGWNARPVHLFSQQHKFSTSTLGNGAVNDTCTFEKGSCPAWTSVCVRGQPCWKRVKAKKIQGGPLTDHTTGKGDGWYSLAVFPVRSDRKAAVLRGLARGPLCFTAWLHISAVKLPNVMFTSTSTGRNSFLLWGTGEERLFFRGQINERRQWQKVVYEEERHRKIEITIRADYTSGTVALDDLSISPGRCPKPPADGSCSFDLSQCKYKNAATNKKHMWRHIVLRKFPQSDIMQRDHTTGTAIGAYTAFWIPKGEEASGALISPVLSKDPNRCLRFFYSLPEASPNRGLRLQLIRDVQSFLETASQQNATTAEERGETLWNYNSSLLPSTWSLAEISYGTENDHRLQFQCYSSHNHTSPFFCAIDDIEVYSCGDKSEAPSTGTETSLQQRSQTTEYSTAELTDTSGRHYGTSCVGIDLLSQL
ncbi:apical endosomal glycoprotein-like [Haemaphysalis longicornis]